MSIMSRYQTRRMIDLQMQNADLFDSECIDDESLLAEMDRSINNVMSVIDIEDNTLLSSDFRGL